MDWLLHLVGLGLQHGGDWSEPQPVQYIGLLLYNGQFRAIYGSGSVVLRF